MKVTFFVILGVVGLYLVGGWLSLTGGSLGVQAENGKTWNAIDVGSQKIGLLEAQFAGGCVQLQKDITDKIVSGRKAMQSARDAGDLRAATAAAGQLSFTVQALSEASVNLGCSTAVTNLMDESSEALNKVSYQREKLISTQQSYAFSRAIFFLVAGAFPDYGILGSDESPTRRLPTSIFRATSAP